jgi:hypothetical protein
MRAMSRKNQFLRIWDEYREAHPDNPGSTHAMLEWAKENGLYAVDQRRAMQRDATQLAEVLREVTVADTDGEAVRVNMPFLDAKQGWLWDDLRTIRHDRMELGVAHGRNRVVGEVKSMARQIKYYGSIHPERPSIQTSFNFENDLRDAGLSLSSSSAPERQAVRPRPVPADSGASPSPSRPSARPNARV